MCTKERSNWEHNILHVLQINTTSQITNKFLSVLSIRVIFQLWHISINILLLWWPIKRAWHKLLWPDFFLHSTLYMLVLAVFANIYSFLSVFWNYKEKGQNRANWWTLIVSFWLLLLMHIISNIFKLKIPPMPPCYNILNHSSRLKLVKSKT